MYGTASILLVWKSSCWQHEEHEASDINTSNRISAVPDLEMFGIHSAHIICRELPRNTDEMKIQIILNTKIYSQVHLSKCRWQALHNRCLSLENHCKGGRIQALGKADEIPTPTHQRRLHKRDNLFSEQDAKKLSVIRSINNTHCRQHTVWMQVTSFPDKQIPTSTNNTAMPGHFSIGLHLVLKCLFILQRLPPSPVSNPIALCHYPNNMAIPWTLLHITSQ